MAFAGAEVDDLDAVAGEIAPVEYAGDIEKAYRRAADAFDRIAECRDAGTAATAVETVRAGEQLDLDRTLRLAGSQCGGAEFGEGIFQVFTRQQAAVDGGAAGARHHVGIAA